MIGKVGVGGGNPIRIQSMITADTRDTGACVKEVLELAEVGCEIVRITAQTRKYAGNLEHIRDGVRGAGCEVPLVADIHFKPDAALEAAQPWHEYAADAAGKASAKIINSANSPARKLNGRSTMGIMAERDSPLIAITKPVRECLYRLPKP
mgnify:CR=1 FL=1